MERLKDALNKMTRFEVALDISQLVEYLDMKEEGWLFLIFREHVFGAESEKRLIAKCNGKRFRVTAILTLMCFLESHPNKFIQIKQRVYGTCSVKCYGGPQQFAVRQRVNPE